MDATVPPAIRFRFENYADALAEDAKIDYRDRTAFIQEWQLRLQEQWLRKVEQLDTDAAAEAAIHLFGEPSVLARVHRGGFTMRWHQLLHFERYKVHRQLVPAAVCLLHDWVRASGSISYTIVATGSQTWKFLVPNWSYYLSVLFAAAVLFPPSASRLKSPLGSRAIRLGGLLLAAWLFWQIGAEWFTSLSELAHQWLTGRWHRPDIEATPVWADALVGAIWTGALVLEGGALIFTAPLAFAEIWDLPGRWRMKQDQARRC